MYYIVNKDRNGTCFAVKDSTDEVVEWYPREQIKSWVLDGMQILGVKIHPTKNRALFRLVTDEEVKSVIFNARTSLMCNEHFITKSKNGLCLDAAGYWRSIGRPAVFNIPPVAEVLSFGLLYSEWGSIYEVNIPDSYYTIASGSFSDSYFRQDKYGNLTGWRSDDINEGRTYKALRVNGLEHIKVFANNCFAYSRLVGEVTLSSSLEVIGSDALSYLPYVNKVTIPASVKVLGSRCVSNCYNLSELVVERGANPYIVGEEVFSNNGNCTYILPREFLARYKKYLPTYMNYKLY